jgi:hypothetical protein
MFNRKDFLDHPKTPILKKPSGKITNINISIDQPTKGNPQKPISQNQPTNRTESDKIMTLLKMFPASTAIDIKSVFNNNSFEDTIDILLLKNNNNPITKTKRRKLVLKSELISLNSNQSTSHSKLRKDSDDDHSNKVYKHNDEEESPIFVRKKTRFIVDDDDTSPCNNHSNQSQSNPTLQKTQIDENDSDCSSIIILKQPKQQSPRTIQHNSNSSSPDCVIFYSNLPVFPRKSRVIEDDESPVIEISNDDSPVIIRHKIEDNSESSPIKNNIDKSEFQTITFLNKAARKSRVIEDDESPVIEISNDESPVIIRYKIEDDSESSPIKNNIDKSEFQTITFLNKASAPQIVKSLGIDLEIAQEILIKTPFFSFNDLSSRCSSKIERAVHKFEQVVKVYIEGD